MALVLYIDESIKGGKRSFGAIAGTENSVLVAYRELKYAYESFVRRYGASLPKGELKLSDPIRLVTSRGSIAKGN